MFLSPIAVAANCPRLSSLKQQKFIILHLQKLEIWNGSHWATIKLSEKLVPSGKIIPLPLPVSRGCCVPGLMAPPSFFKGSLGCWAHCVTGTLNLLSLFFSEGPCDYIGSTQIIQDCLLKSWTAHTCSLFCHVRSHVHGFWGWGHGLF